jgi:IS605 OrfB family transposase
MTKGNKPSRDESVTVRTLRVRLKDKHAGLFKGQAREVNLVWNFTQELCLKHLERTGNFMSAFDVAEYTKGAAKEGLSLHSQTVQATSEEYVRRRKQFKKRKLSWRTSKGSRKNLGWIPFKSSAITYRNGQVHYQGVPLSLWDSYGLKDYKLSSGSFSEDARGRWYMNVTVEIKKAEKPKAQMLNDSAIGIDLGLKDLMATSNGFKVEAQNFYRDLEPKLAVAQRAGKKGRVKAIYAKIGNRRKDFLHKHSTNLIASSAAIFVGNVNASGLAKTSIAKSVLDSGWSTFRTMLQYKCDDAGVWFKEVNESYSTQECSVCHKKSGPKGQDGLKVRQWTCVHCNTLHDRDTNAAINIRQRGLDWLQKEFTSTVETKVGEPVGNKVSQHQLTSSVVAAAPGIGRPAEGILVL